MSIRGGMLDPAIDAAGEPFSYFWHPTDVIGALFAPVASEVTPEGYIYTGFGELMFFVDNPPTPVDQRVKTLYRGHLPIVRYAFCDNSIGYRFSLFAADIGGKLTGLPLNVARVELSNDSEQQRTAFLSTAYRFMPPVQHLKGPVADYRFGLRQDLVPEPYRTGQGAFDPNWSYSFAADALLRDDRLIYCFPTDPKPQQISLALTDPGLRAVRFFSGEVRDHPNARHTLHPHTPMGVVTYRITLAPGERSTLTFRMPFVPVPAESEEAALIRSADPDDLLARTVDAWEQQLAPVRMHFPERKVQEYLLANTVFDLLAIDQVGDDLVINVNKFQYHRLYPGNCSNMCIALDYMGLHDIAGRCLRYFRKVQLADGSIRNPHHPEGQSHEITGYALWAWNRHYQLTGDKAFLEAVYPGVQAAVAWMKRITAQDPLGLMPPATVADDAMLANVRQTGMSLWVLIALRSATELAAAAGQATDREDFQAEYERYRRAFEEHLQPQLHKSGGVIPPALEKTLDGNRWDDLLLLYPVVLFDPFDPRVTATINEARTRYAEGILGFGWQRAVARSPNAGWPVTDEDAPPTVEAEDYLFDDTLGLHYWQTPNNAQNALVRGTAQDQKLAVQDLYALLLHTSSTHAPQEFGTFPWSTRDFLNPHNILPDGAASAKTIELLRNMLLREFGDELVLLSALSPAWLKPGRRIRTVAAPTTFGPVSMEIEACGQDTGSWSLRLSSDFWSAPERLVVRVPWFYQPHAIAVDGDIVAVEDGQVRAPSDARRIEFRGQFLPQDGQLSFDTTVEAYKAEYRQRYEEFLKTGRIEA